MRDLVKRLAILTPAFAVAAGSGGAGHAGNSAQGEPHRALTLSVVEGSDDVEIQLIAHSDVSQQVEYSLELVGNSRSRHNGNTSIPAGDRQVLSRMKTNVTDTWCATVNVTEESGESYTLTAGVCA